MDEGGAAVGSSSCPFCTIASTYAPIHPSEAPSHLAAKLDPDKLSPPAYVLLSTEHVIAFLDIAPLTRGHVLLTPRHHKIKIGELAARDAAEVGRSHCSTLTFSAHHTI